MANYAKMHAVDELPPQRRHYTKLRLDARAMVVLRNSRRGKWTRYAHFPTRETAVSKGTKLRRSDSFAEVGDLKVEIRFDAGKRRWILFLKFEDLTVTDTDIAENVADLGGESALDREEIAEVPEG